MKIEQNVRDVLAVAHVEGNQLTLVGQLDRKLYTDVNKVLEAIGGKWSRKDKAHVFETEIEDVLDQVLLTGEFSNKKQDFGQFDTSLELAEHVVAQAGITPGMTVFEPSAGIGNLVWAALAVRANVFANEIDPVRFEKLRMLYFPTGGGATNLDFLQMPQVRAYERVIMNPPFARQADIDHVMHALGFVQSGGRLLSIMSSSVVHRTNKKAEAFKKIVADYGATVTPLPEGSFKASGTNVNTVLASFIIP